MFLNAVATRIRVTLTSATPRLEAELPARVFAGARLQGFIRPVSAGPGVQDSEGSERDLLA
jgi:hypothetical protein